MTTNNDTTGMRTMTVQWHPDAVARAIKNARATRDADVNPLSDGRIHTSVPLTWQDVAVFVDLAAALEAERVDFASKSATLGYVTDQLTELLDDSFGHRPENLASAVLDVQHAVKVLSWLHAEAVYQRDKARTALQDAEGYRLAVEQVLDGALGPNAEDGTGEGIAADVAYLVRQRDEARAEANDLHDRARHVREDNDEGYARHREELIKALGQHADPSALTIQQLIERDVVDLVEAFDTIEAELVEWRTGQRAVEASAVQWTQIQSTLDATLAAVQQLAGRLDEDDREKLRGELPVGGDLCPVGVESGPDGEDYAPCNAPTAPSLETCADHADGPVTETTAEPVRFTHDVED
ncbi:MAG: hypothetical protein HOQ21_10025 [Dermatophilaceae bacterium]|nr:hypothetical protein [Dermatophilaceae bacterium]